eukprot:6878525-Heterocapsa_arctica.AAC.1
MKAEWIRKDLTLEGKREALIPEINPNDIFACPPEHLEDVGEAGAGVLGFLDDEVVGAAVNSE